MVSSFHALATHKPGPVSPGTPLVIDRLSNGPCPASVCGPLVLFNLPD